MKDHRVEVITKKLKNLLPNCEVQWKHTGVAKYSGSFLNKVDFEGGVIHLVSGKPSYEYQVFMNGTGLWLLSIFPKLGTFSKSEKKILNALLETIACSLSDSTYEHARLAMRIGAYYSFEIVLLSRILKKNSVNKFWVITELIENLKNLTYKRYEGAEATSGYIYTSQPEDYVKCLNRDNFTYEAFNNEVPITDEFFNSPASFRYVDGRNSFYLVNNQGNVIGVVKCSDLKKYSIIERCSEEMYIDLISAMPGRAWIGFVGLNSDVIVKIDEDYSFKWDDNNWYIRDRSIMSECISKHGCTNDFTENLTKLLYTLSELRHGTVICIPNSATPPPVIGKIDTSKVGEELRNQLSSKNLGDLLNSGQAIGLLSSDGLTTFSKSGEIVSCGDIIDISTASKGGLTGGGRSQAALAASYYGLSVKVSEDGPITVFEDGSKIFELH